MNKDLEETLTELGPGYRDMVARMKAPFEERPPRWRFAQSWLVAASVGVAIVAGVLFFQSRPPSLPASPASGVYTIAYDTSSAAVDEMVRTQSPDGSWQNDFITRQNAAALRDVAGARLAYRKAVRYLRSRGLVPLTETELSERALLAQTRR